ncbi:TRAF3-interacting protein 1-like isoform X2 [Eriocheir sinensis]|uniref:TRAF3-interacting protein 1-like isoform X2 n=1 Tax=Eriocheir sinensis TaxID=95602 RepID=UPI0021C9B811|nr:TRAF3-interacting protein 1-like isoform X2 [Eriocheir sinensis]
MSVSVAPEVLKKTQAELGRFIKKPPLTDKLLSKPPFRFLHDVINAVITETGFLAGLYTDEELSAQNIKDKDAKIEFLQKCIDATILATGDSLSVRPSKIVAGHEPDKTNEWLQALGKAVEKNVDSKEAVSQVLSGVKPQTKKSEKKAEKPKEKEKSAKGPERAKKGGTTNNKPLKDKPDDPKAPRTPAKDNKPPPNPKGTTTTTTAKPAAAAKNAPAKNAPAKNAPNAKSPAKPAAANRSSTVKTSKSKDEKEKATKKPRTKEDAGSKGKEKEGKEKKQKSTAKEKGKSTKSRPASRMNQAKESGKENSPPHEVIGAEELLTNGHASPEEMVSTPKRGPSRPPSARHGSRTAAEDELEMTNGPSSMINAELEGELPAMGGGEEQEQEQEQPDMPGSPSNNNNIDPAILKAMDPHNDQLQGVDVTRSEPPDSGVGSLESPKHPAKEQQQEAAPPPAAPTPAPKAGPQPLRALEPFGGEDGDTPALAQPEAEASGSQFREPPARDGSARPRTGRRSARPPSARPAPPRVRERREVPKEEIQRPGTAKPVANVILLSGEADSDDDDDNFTVEESKPAVAVEDDAPPLDAAAASGAAAAAAAVGEDGQGAGLLVAQILETKKEMEDGRRNAFSPETPGHRRVPIEQTLLSDANRKKERELIQKDVQKLSSSIQSITRSVNPLAKMLDYLQEDLDSMHKELETWQNENKLLVQTLKKEQSATEQALEPLGYQLTELETAVQDQRDKLSAVKSNILRNNEKISRLMAGINLNV